MIPEDRFSNTVADAASYEAYRSGGDVGRYSSYDLSDARADAADDAWQEMVSRHLDPMVDEVIERVSDLEDEIDSTGQDQPHPWTWERHLLAIWNDEEQGEDAVREEVEERFRDEAEDAAREEAEEEAYNQP